MNTDNPFSFSAATDLSTEDILYYYITEHNYSRFIQSKRNVFLLGERGTGKTMTLLYHSLDVQRLRAERDGSRFDASWIGVYVPCNTPLIHRLDHELLDEYRGFSLSEHFLTLSIVDATVRALDGLLEMADERLDRELCAELEAVLAIELPPGRNLLDRMRIFVAAEIRRTQQAVNEALNDFYYNVFSFATLVLPILDVLRRVPELGGSHFLFLIDDADYLNDHQVASLNAWIAYREHSLFSFKVATSKVMRPSMLTPSGGAIEEGHDFTIVDLESTLHNERTDFGRLAWQIVKRRLERVGSQATPEEFFPISGRVIRQLEKCKVAAKSLAEKKFPCGTEKQISDYVYKYHRAIFFRRRHKANRPTYSGFDMITFLSTGIVRNLLEPCYVMYDIAISRANEDTSLPLEVISPTIQNEAILKLSERPWIKLGEGLHKQVANCTREQSDQITRLFEALARLFRARLRSPDCSEPRATSFTISGTYTKDRLDVEELMVIARKALLIYVRLGTAKDAGSRETYYVPTRMLWPSRGLDPLGQHARVSLKARDLMAAARGERNPWTEIGEGNGESILEGTMFDDTL